MTTHEFVLRENTLTDNLLVVPPKGYVFKGGYIAKIKEYTYANSWSDKENVLKFRSKNALFNYLDKHYPDFDASFYDTALQIDNTY